MKRCKKCKEEKEFSQYYRHCASKDGLRSSCKLCLSVQKKKYRENNREKVLATDRKYRENNREKHKEKIVAYQNNYRQTNKEELAAYQRDYREKNKEKVKASRKKTYAKHREKIRQKKREQYIKNREKVLLKSKEYYEKNKEKAKANVRQYRKDHKDVIKKKRKDYQRRYRSKINERARKRRKTNPNFAVRGVLGGRLRDALRGQTKSATTMALLGCTIEELKKYLQKQFVEGMTWENRSTTWHIDHMLPCSSFDLSDKEQQRRCFHYSNLQPLFASENMSKGNKNIYGPYMKWDKGEWHIKINGEYMPRSRQVNELIPTQYFYPIKWMISKYSEYN